MTDTSNRDGQPWPGDDADQQAEHDSAEVASTSVDEHDTHQQLVDEPRGDGSDQATQAMPVVDEAQPERGWPTAPVGHPQATPADEADEWQRSWDDAGGGAIEPTVIAPSRLRGPSHDAEAGGSSLEQAPDGPGDEFDGTASVVDPATGDATAIGEHDRPELHATERTPDRDAPSSDDAATRVTPAAQDDVAPTSPPELVEPQRPTLSLRGEPRPDLADTAPFAGLVGAGAAGAAGGAAAASARPTPVEEPAPTQAMPVADRADEAADATQATAVHPTSDRTEPQFEVGEPDADDRTRVQPRVADPTEPTTRRGSIDVDDETAREAATGTPIVLVETPTPPRKRGARGVGFLVVLLSTIVFGALLAAGILAIGYLFDRQFVLQDELQTIWMRPSWVLPVVVFFVAYWIMTLIVNRAGWWAHVLGAFLIAILVYAAQLAGAFLETQSNQWDLGALLQITLDDLRDLLLAPAAILTFLLAREVPVWFGGIVARRGRTAKRRNREAIDEYERENARKIEEYEQARA